MLSGSQGAAQPGCVRELPAMSRPLQSGSDLAVRTCTACPAILGVSSVPLSASKPIQ